MDEHFTKTILKAARAEDLFEIEMIQELWSGYGHIYRYGLKGGPYQTVVVKHVCLPKGGSHPRGWNSDRSHQRKLRSYEVETAWYGRWSSRCTDRCRVPRCLAVETKGPEVLMVLEDLNGAGFPKPKTSLSWNQIKNCLSWLANFHAVFMGERPEGLWKTGTYWHLKTRPDELKALSDKPLKNAARAIDQKLSQTPFLTFVHGDAKLANFCFSKDGGKVAAVDFQYVGGGCGMKDVAYFIGSCLHEDQCAQMEQEILDCYFTELKTALKTERKEVDPEEVERSWRPLYPVAWTDFHRFIKGWSPGHWKINSYSERLARKVVEEI